MKIFKIYSLAAAVLIVAACHTTKKTETTASTPAAKETPAAPVSEAVKSKNGVFAPGEEQVTACLLYTSPSPRDRQKSRMPSSA